MLRFRESRLSLDLLQLMGEGWRCSSLGLPVYWCPPCGLLNPALLLGYSVIRSQSLRPLVLNCRLHRPKNMNIILAKKSILAMNLLFLIRANSRIYQRKRYRGTSLRWFCRRQRLPLRRVFPLSSLIYSSSSWDNVLTLSFLTFFYRGGHW